MENPGNSCHLTQFVAFIMTTGDLCTVVIIRKCNSECGNGTNFYQKNIGGKTRWLFFVPFLFLAVANPIQASTLNFRLFRLHIDYSSVWPFAYAGCMLVVALRMGGCLPHECTTVRACTEANTQMFYSLVPAFNISLAFHLADISCFT